MKKICFVLSVLILILYLPGKFDIKTQTNPIKDRFSVAIYNWLQWPGFRNGNHPGWYDYLKIDLQHSYTDRSDYGGIMGGFYDELNIYKDNITNAIKYDHPSESKKLFERAKIIRGAYGQRSTYNAEHPPGWENSFPKYYYSNGDEATGEEYTENWMNETVSGRRCSVGIHTPGKYIVYKLYENCEQINFLTDSLNPDKHDVKYFASDNKERRWKWYIKPRMRIPLSVANDPQRQNDEVVSLEIYNFSDDEPSLVIPIYVKNFKKTTQNYDGRYIELYYEDNDYLNISVHGSHLRKGFEDSFDINSSKVDYRVKWSGNVDVWLDYVRVDDEWAHYLFEPDYPGYLNYRFTEKIQEEVNAFGTEELFGYFHMDECQFNCIPCIAEVNRILRDSLHSNSLILMSAQWEVIGSAGLRNPPERYNYFCLNLFRYYTLLRKII